jgi:PAS domain S-box-containing protein
MFVYTYRIESGKEMHGLKTIELQILRHHGELVSASFNEIVSDLMCLTRHYELQNYFKNGSTKHKRHLAGEVLALSGRKDIYDQIRYLDGTGMEIMRINYNNGAPSVVPDEMLQPKGKRYYFTDTINLGKGEIYVSPFDLNFEHGEIEMPVKPMIRFATPVFDHKGIKRGIVILNYLGEDLINGLRKKLIESHGQPMLLNSEGYWLLGPESEKEWGFMHNNEATFGKDFPNAWEQITGKESGQFNNKKGLFTFITIYPVMEGWKSSTGSPEAFMPSAKQLDARACFWKAVSHVPAETLKALTMPVARNLMVMCSIVFLVLAIVSWYLSQLSLKRAREKETLLAYERFHQSVIDGVGEPMMVIGTDYRIKLMNRVARELAFGTEGSLEALLCHRVSHHSEAPCTGLEHPCPMKQVLETGEPVTVEHEHTGTGGETRLFEILASPLWGDDGSIQGIIETSRDVTERRKAEAAIKQAEEEWRNTFNSISDYVFIQGTDFRILKVNKALADFLKMKLEEIIGKHCYKLFHNMDEPWHGCPHVKMLRDKKAITEEIEDGNLGFPMLVTASPIFDDKGEIIASVHIAKDITERKQAEAAVIRERDRANNYLDIAGVMLIVLDREQRVTLINRKGCEVLGSNEADIIGKNWFDNYLPERLRNDVKDVYESLIAGEVEPVEYYENPVLDNKGEEKIIAWHNTILKDENGDIQSVLSSGEDITERMRAEEALRQSLRDKELLMKELHHRVKNNLAVVSSLLRLQSGQVKDEESRGYFLESQNRVNAISMIHEKLYRSATFSKVNFSEYIRELAGQLFKIYKVNASRIRLNINIPDIMLDIDTMIPCGLMVNELISNVLKYAFPDDRDGELTIGLSEAEDKEYSLSISDNGAGIPEGMDINNIETLGMRIVTALVSQIGGTLQLSREGGTEFSITFRDKLFDR